MISITDEKGKKVMIRKKDIKSVVEYESEDKPCVRTCLYFVDDTHTIYSTTCFEDIDRMMNNESLSQLGGIANSDLCLYYYKEKSEFKSKFNKE